MSPKIEKTSTPRLDEVSSNEMREIVGGDTYWDTYQEMVKWRHYHGSTIVVHTGK